MSNKRDPLPAGPLATPERRAAIGVLLWLLVLALVSLLVSVPFRLTGSTGTFSDAHAIFLNGLLVSITAFVALMASDAFGLRERSGRSAAVVLWGALLASAIAGIGGILDVLVGGLSFVSLALLGELSLGVALVALMAGLMFRAAATRRTRDWAAAVATMAALGAVFMAYVAAWMLTFGDWPRALVHGYPTLVGMTASSTWLGQLATGYAHLLPAAIVALAVGTAATVLPPEREGGILVRVGLIWVTAGTVLSTLIFMVSGFSVAQPPIFFQSGPAGLNGLWASNLAVVIAVVLGALVTLVGLGRERLPGAVQLWAAALIGALLFVILAGVGSYVEMNESLYGLGALNAPNAAQNAAFTWFVQDVGWLALPALMAVLASLHRLVPAERSARLVPLWVAAGGVVAFVGGIVYVFAAPAPTGVGLVITGVGLALALVGVLLAARAATLPVLVRSEDAA